MKDRTFIIDSKDLDSVKSRLYGYMITGDLRVSIDEIPEKPTDTGFFVMIKRTGNTITVSQDICGSFGLYLYRKDGRFCLSDSLYRLALHIKKGLSFNRDGITSLLYANDAVISSGDTLINEIQKLDAGTEVHIDISGCSITITEKEFPYFKTVPDSRAAFDRLDKWYFRWVRILKNLADSGAPLTSDLSGGLDTRIILSMLLNGNIDIPKQVMIHTHSKVHVKKDPEDSGIAGSIAGAFGFPLNSAGVFTEKTTGSHDAAVSYSICRDTSFGRSILSKYNLSCFSGPVFAVKGIGSCIQGGRWHDVNTEVLSYLTPLNPGWSGEGISASPKSAAEYIRLKLRTGITTEKMISGYSHIESHRASYFFKKVSIDNRDALKAVEWMAADRYVITPFTDPLILSFDYDPEDTDERFLGTLILDRYFGRLLDFPLQGGRYFSDESVKKAKELNRAFPVTDRPVFDRPVFAKRDPSGNLPPVTEKTVLNQNDLKSYILSVTESRGFRDVKDALGSIADLSLIPDIRDIADLNRPCKINALLAVYELASVIGTDRLRDALTDKNALADSVDASGE